MSLCSLSEFAFGVELPTNTLVLSTTYIHVYFYILYFWVYCDYFFFVTNFSKPMFRNNNIIILLLFHVYCYNIIKYLIIIVIIISLYDNRI